MSGRIRRLLPVLLVAVAAVSVAASTQARGSARSGGDTRTPIKHLVVIFQENVSFDHYFGTYPNAANKPNDGQAFAAAPGTPSIDGLSPTLLTSNPNTAQPARLDSSPLGIGSSPGGEITCDQDHNYSDEQQAFDGGLMDQFVQSVGTDGGTHRPGNGATNGGPLCNPSIVMDYYDGNTVTAFWNYAQHYAMSDNSFSPTFGPSSPGAVNLVSGDTGGVGLQSTKPPASSAVSVATASAPNADITADVKGGFSLTSDAQPYFDDCSTRDAVSLSGRNVGDLLNAAGLSWGWFQGGFRPTESFSDALAATSHTGQSTSTFVPDEFANAGFQANVPNSTNQGLCDAVHPVGVALGETAASHQFGFKDDYIPHHEPFQYYASTANPHHLTIPTDTAGNDTLAGLETIGTDTQTYAGSTPQFDTPNHQYDISDFDQLVAAIANGTIPPSALPAVSFLKAPGYEDGHAAYSDPADEQAFITREIDALEQTPDWSTTAIVIAYDDSDGWYDHKYPGVVNGSASLADNLTNTVKGKISSTNQVSQQCGTGAQAAAALAGEQGRCGFGPRQPLLLVSPCARQNAVDHDMTDLGSVPNFIEYNWSLPSITGSFDQVLAGTDASEGVSFDLAGLFDFSHCNAPAMQLDTVTGQIDLQGANLDGRNLKGANLSGAEAANATLRGDNLEGVFAENANLQNSSLQGVNLKGGDLRNVNLQGASLQGTNLDGADLTGANLSGADLRGSNVHRVTWAHTTCPDGTSSDADGGTCVGHLAQ
jgi:phospholipase C